LERECHSTPETVENTSEKGGKNAFSRGRGREDAQPKKNWKGELNWESSVEPNEKQGDVEEKPVI